MKTIEKMKILEIVQWMQTHYPDDLCKNGVRKFLFYPEIIDLELALQDVLATDWLIDRLYRRKIGFYDYPEMTHMEWILTPEEITESWGNIISEFERIYQEIVGT